MNTPQRFRAKACEIEAMQFNGLDDYLKILDWMRESGWTSADDIQYSTPIMLIPSPEGTAVGNPGDWMIKSIDGNFVKFYCVDPATFAAAYEPDDT